MQADLLFQLALHLIPGLGGKSIRKLIAYCGTAEAVFSCRKELLEKIPNLQKKALFKHLGKEILNDAEKQMAVIEKQNIKVYNFYNEDYPNRLKQIPDAPIIFFFKGNPDCLKREKNIAVVGTRKSTSYGRSNTDLFVDQLKDQDALIISGLAYGIDITAHKAALRNGLNTVAVLAGGFDHIYPKAHIKEARAMLEMGGWISEYLPDVIPEPPRFPARNRIVAGLSDAVMVVEAAVRGGALITALLSNDYNRETFALPGNLGQDKSAGCNQLIADHKAHIYSSFDKFIEIMNWDIDSQESKKVSFEHLNASEKLICEALVQETKGLSFDHLSWISKVPIQKLPHILINLELKGIIKPMPGKMFQLI